MNTRHLNLRIFLLVGVVLGVGALAVPAVALDDGGGRSVFATGAGNRALGLGGAYVAVADDASAVIFNPAGLGLVQRKEFQASQTDLFGFGFSEQYASLVLPHWRLGTASVTWRSFGVDGLEARDERGFLLADDLEDRETEVMLGYGRPLLDGNLSVGGAFKVQHHALAGYTGSGFGLDLGVWARPLSLAGRESAFARGLALGLSLRNVLEPQIKLQTDAVPDPSAIRTGLAWSGDVSDGVRFLAAVDLEKTSGMDSRLHAGTEVRLFDTLALRAGTADGSLTAGAGLEWHGIGADYQFEDNPLGEIHRFGLALRFGRTVQESRVAVLQANEAALQARLAEAFIERANAQEDQLLTTARTALKSGRWEDAFNAIGTLRVLAPERSELPLMAAEAYAGLAEQQESQSDLAGAALSWRRALAAVPGFVIAETGLARVEAESDRRSQRTRAIKDKYEAALEAFAQDDLVAARTGFAAILQLAPADRDAATMLARTEAALTRRATALGEEAISLGQAGQMKTARERLAEAMRLDAQAPGLTAAQSELARLEAEMVLAAVRAKPAPTAAAVVPTAGSEISAERRREIADVYRRGVQAMQAQRRDEAVSYWEMVWAVDPNYEKVAEYLGQEYVARGMEAYAEGSLLSAVNSWENALRVDPADQRARGYLERARHQLSRMEQINVSDGR